MATHRLGMSWSHFLLVVCILVLIKLFTIFVSRAGLVLIMPAPGSKVIKLFSCSTQLSQKFILLMNVKMSTIEYLNLKIPSILAFNEYEQFKCHA